MNDQRKNNLPGYLQTDHLSKPESVLKITSEEAVEGVQRMKKFAVADTRSFSEASKQFAQKSMSKHLEEQSIEAVSCPECFKIVTLDELNTFGGFCEECSEDTIAP